MKSLRELRNELIGVRLDATNVSLWNTAVAVKEGARVAISEALQLYEFTVQRQYMSVTLPASGTSIVALPHDIHRIVDFRAVSDTAGGPRVPVTGYELRPTTETNLLYLQVKSYSGVRNVRIIYETRVTDVPPECVIASAGLGTTAAFVNVSGGVPAAQWRAPGYFEITPQTDTDQREVVRYGAVTPTGFTGLERNVGIRTMPMGWSGGELISPIVEIPDQAVPVIVQGAQAAMYDFWVRHRALYEEFTAIASLQQLDLSDMLRLVATKDARASNMYRRTKTAPEVTRARTKRARA